MGAFTSFLAVAGIGMQAYGMYKSGQDAASAAAYNANLYNVQAGIIENKKALTRQEYDRMIDRLEGSTVAAIASSGYDLSGSFLEVMNDSLTQAELDRQKEIYNLNIEKFQAQGAAGAATRAGRAASTAGTIGALSTVLTEGNEWYQKYGGFGKAANNAPAYSTHGAPTPSSQAPWQRKY